MVNKTALWQFYFFKNMFFAIFFLRNNAYFFYPEIIRGEKDEKIFENPKFSAIFSISIS